jgi:hypothetical protein
VLIADTSPQPGSLNTAWPVTISQRTTPSEYRSERMSTATPANCFRLANSGVPAKAPVYCRIATIASAQSKSFQLMDGLLVEVLTDSAFEDDMRSLAVPVIFLLLALPAFSVELFRYRGAARDGGTLEYVFETGEQSGANTVSKERVAEIAADFMTSFYGIQVGALETQELRQQPIPFWLVSFSDTVKGALRQLYFVVVLPDGRVVEPLVTKRL